MPGMTGGHIEKGRFAYSPDLRGKVAVVTGGGGAICGAIAQALGHAGVSVAVWDIAPDAARRVAQIIAAAGGAASAVECDATARDSVKAATAATLSKFGTIDILINGAGGSRKEATTSEELSFYDIDPDAIERVFDLNYMSAVLTCQTVGPIFAEKGRGALLNIASIAGLTPVTRALAYSNAKAAMINFTQWLAVHMAKEYSPAIRVNAIAPGFVLTEQNRFLLVDEKTGAPTARGNRIIDQVPMGRYGDPHEVVGGALWLVSEAASFVTGAVVPVDGGYTAYSGV